MWQIEMVWASGGQMTGCQNGIELFGDWITQVGVVLHSGGILDGNMIMSDQLSSLSEMLLPT